MSLRSERPLARSAAGDCIRPPRQFDSTLSPLLRRATLQLPAGFNPRTATLAQQWRQDAGGDDEAIVRRALQWITTDFSYTLDTPAAGRDPIDEFLFGYKAGFCEHFSSAFVVLMRNAGVPARVVTGFAGGTRNRIGDYWVVRRMDAHAWAEVCCSARLGTGRPDGGRGTGTHPGHAGRPPAGRHGHTTATAVAAAGPDGVGCAAAGTIWCCPSMRAASSNCSSLSGWTIWVPGSWSPASSWRPAGTGVDGLAAGPRGANATRCCAPGIASGDATPASAWPENRTKPHSTGHSGFTGSDPTRPCSRSASVSPTRATLELATTSPHYCGTCAGIARLPSLPMNTKFLLTAVATLALSACATAPKPLQGQFSLVSPRDSVATSRSARRSVGAVASSKPSLARARPASRSSRARSMAVVAEHHLVRCQRRPLHRLPCRLLRPGGVRGRS